MSQSKSSTVFCKLELHSLSKKTLLKISLHPGLNLTIFSGTGPRRRIRVLCPPGFCDTENVFELDCRLLPVKVFKTLNGRRSYNLSKFQKIVDKIMLRCISAPEAADPTNAWRLFPPVFRKRPYERSR